VPWQTNRKLDRDRKANLKPFLQIVCRNKGLGGEVSFGMRLTSLRFRICPPEGPFGNHHFFFIIWKSKILSNYLEHSFMIKCQQGIDQAREARSGKDIV
jgi:hypothetical protein